MQITAQELAQLLNGTVEGDPGVSVHRPSKIEEGGAGSVSFLGNTKYEHFAYSTTASILLVSKDFKPKEAIQATLVRVDDVYAAVALLFEKFGQVQQISSGIDSSAIIHSSVSMGKNVAVGMHTVIMDNAKIGDNCVLHPQVFIGKGVQLGNHVTLHPGVKIMHSCVIGSNCTIHANTVVGSDGFGFAPQEDGTYKKIAQIGNVIIEDEVEIGSNTTIDRASLGSTIIRKGAKLDNLIQVAHNVEIGENTVIASQAGIAGSTKIGKNCRIGGQVGFVGHVRIADGTQIQAQSGIASAVEQPNTALFGSPAIPYRDYIRSYAIFKKLPDLYKKIHILEKLIKKQ
jgi:UDP-3-O-[3-hydroxymyristoyl] glucosamine N-acyltransferase